MDAPRIGVPGFIDNQSLLGAATRLAPGVATTAGLLSAAAVVGLALVALHRARTERAMRHVGSLPSSGLKLPIVVILGIVCVAVLVGLLL